MKKRIASLLLCLMTVFALLPTASAANEVAYANAQDVEVDGKVVRFQMYALRDERGYDTNYVKLRDVAYTLSNGPVSFDVDYDQATRTIEILTELPYSSANGSEMSAPFSGDRAYKARPTALLIDYTTVKTLDAIILTDNSGGDHTYFKLRDLGEALGFEVDWVDGRVTVDTGARTLSAAAVAMPSAIDETLELVNKERAAVGISPLALSPELNEAAQIRASELIAYYSHVRPDGRKCDTVLAEVGADKSIRLAGENIANGTMAKDAATVMSFWMNSENHRAAILNDQYDHIGIACVYSPKDPDRYYWVQVFTGPGDAPAWQPDPDRVFSTDPLIHLNMTESSHMLHGSGIVVPTVDDAWVAAHGEYTVAWSVDNTDVLSVEPASKRSTSGLYKALAVGAAKITCTVTGADGYTAEAYCYLFVLDH